MITLTIYIPVPDVPFLIMLFLASPTLCYIAVRLGDRDNRCWYRRAKRDVADAWKEIADERDANVQTAERLNVREDNLDDHEEELQLGQQALVRRAKEVEAAIAATSEQYDTVLDLRKIEDLPHPFENADTIAIPPVEEER